MTLLKFFLFVDTAVLFVGSVQALRRERSRKTLLTCAGLFLLLLFTLWMAADTLL